MLPLLPTRRRLRYRSTSCLLCIGLVALYHSLLAGLLMHHWVASSAGLQHEKLELVGRVSELSGRVSTLQQQATEATARAAQAQRQLQARSVDSLQAAPKPAPAPKARAVQPASAPPPSRCSREASEAPPPDPKASSESVIIVGGRTRITLLTAATLRLEHLSAAAPAGRFDDRASFAFVNRRRGAILATLHPPRPLLPFPPRLLTMFTAVSPPSATAGFRRRRTPWAWRGAHCSRQARPPPPPPPPPRSMRALPAYASSCARPCCGSSTSCRATQPTPHRCCSRSPEEGTRVAGRRWRRRARAWPCMSSPWRKQRLSRLGPSRLMPPPSPSGGRASLTLASCLARCARSSR